MLHVRHRKSHMRSKRELEEERELFGESEQRRKRLSQVNRSELSSRFSQSRSLRKKESSPSRKNFDEVQDELLQNSKLRVLQDELREKFI